MLQCSNKNCLAVFGKDDIKNSPAAFRSGYCPKCGCEIEGGWGINVDDYLPAPVPAPAPAKKAPAKKAPAKKKTAAKKKAAAKKD
tara:strand:- start:5050 stop:5304 length:255 start_codon:yes stop_codon:yes gene_type:complete